MYLIRKEPRQLDQLKEILDDRLFGLTFFPQGERSLSGMRDAWLPAVDVSHDKDSITVKADIPGMKQEDIGLTVEDTVLTIRGERKSENERKEGTFHRFERSYGVFERSIDLGVPVKSENVRAHYKNGVLEVVLPKSEQVKAKQIKIDVQ